ncbi:hypothetical protein SKAU_G00338910 [Synaphobranchus kaupii]|uniref:Uncharacterized protein n=1 Tax=Synaphobranchus kaupii TaxID=118154 RepID=A0A9Q1EMJ5_SYNKA|nr:hypothetical protein SKAU_G00338910 [Synaphobranchus kaupii]
MPLLGHPLAHHSGTSSGGAARLGLPASAQQSRLNPHDSAITQQSPFCWGFSAVLTVTIHPLLFSHSLHVK